MHKDSQLAFFLQYIMLNFFMFLCLTFCICPLQRYTKHCRVILSSDPTGRLSSLPRALCGAMPCQVTAAFPSLKSCGCCESKKKSKKNQMRSTTARNVTSSLDPTLFVSQFPTDQGPFFSFLSLFFERMRLILPLESRQQSTVMQEN